MRLDRYSVLTLTALYSVKNGRHYAWFNDFPQVKIIEADSLSELKQDLKKEFVKMYKLSEVFNYIKIDIKLVRNNEELLVKVEK